MRLEVIMRPPSLLKKRFLILIGLLSILLCLGLPQSAAGATTLSCTPTSGPVRVGMAYSATCTAAGGTSPYHWSTGTLPAGIKLSAATGATVRTEERRAGTGTNTHQAQLTDSSAPAQSAPPQT